MMKSNAKVSQHRDGIQHGTFTYCMQHQHSHRTTRLGVNYSWKGQPEVGYGQKIGVNFDLLGTLLVVGVVCGICVNEQTRPLAINNPKTNRYSPELVMSTETVPILRLKWRRSVKRARPTHSYAALRPCSQQRANYNLWRLNFSTRYAIDSVGTSQTGVFVYNTVHVLIQRTRHISVRLWNNMNRRQSKVEERPLYLCRQ